jgi:4-hydroxy-4-methyl-2-oxoglutarate aldolase
MNTESSTTDPLVSAFAHLDTACVSDAMDKLGLEAGCHGITPVCAGVKAAGRAFTVKYRAIGVVERGTVGDFLDDVPVGGFVVIDNAGRTDCTVWGDIMTTLAHRKGIAGTLIDGVCRDIPKIKQLRYPLFSRGYYMMTGKDRVEIESVNQPVSISGRQVRQGDIVLADDSGVVIVPASKAEQILAIAQQIEAIEQAILQGISQGSSLREVRQNLGYHSLQTQAPSANEAKP